MIFAWSIAAFRKYRFPDIDVLIVGTDPILSVVTTKVWKLLRPQTQIVHWCFDLYPEAAIAQGILRRNSLTAKFLKHILRGAYASCDLIIDIGGCMRSELQKYQVATPRATLTPWALVEPPQVPLVDNTERKNIFGRTKLGILYSGNFGLAHSYGMFDKLIGRLSNEDIQFSFSIRGNRADKLKNVLTQNHKQITFVPFATLEHLEARLSAADIHLACLRPEWTGTVVASKFFGSLAAGRPVIFTGREDCALAQWINEHQVGWVLTDQNLESVTEKLIHLSKSPQELKSLRQHCYYIYHKHFSRKYIMDQWNVELRKLLLKTSEIVENKVINHLPHPIAPITGIPHCDTPSISPIGAHNIINYPEQTYETPTEKITQST
ncbi:MAG: glycosyltransferase family 4 protein [Planctomycetes bacterium]|nr:glycosyltransferase family 4 protein [Planctomycetota bacterium]